MKERENVITAFLYAGVVLGFLFWVSLAQSAAGDSTLQETIIDHRDMHLELEALSAAEGLPYEYLTPEEKVVKTRIDPRDIYLDLEALSAAEGLPYRYQMGREKYMPVKYSPLDRKLDIEKMVSDDPSFIKGQENY